jgi:hypothetical protein
LMACSKSFKFGAQLGRLRVLIFIGPTSFNRHFMCKQQSLRK